MRSVTCQFFPPPFATEGALDDSDFSPQIPEKREQERTHSRAVVAGPGDPGWGKIFAARDWGVSAQNSLYNKWRDLLKPEALLTTTARIRYYRQKIHTQFLQTKNPGHFVAITPVTGVEATDGGGGDDDEEEEEEEKEDDDDNHHHDTFLEKNFLTKENAQHLNAVIMRVVTSATAAAKADTDEKSAATIEKLKTKLRVQCEKRKRAESNLREVCEKVAKVAKFARLLNSETQ